MGRLPYKYVVAIVFVCGVFMDAMDTTIVNVALPTLSRDFHASTASIEWVILGYLLSLAVWIPASGWIGDRIGTKKVFLFALAMFTLASAMCGLAQTEGQLVAFRVFQGVGGGMLVPVGTAMLFRAFPPIERAKASSVLIVPTVLAPALGPIIGGWLVTDVSWRWIFYVNLPIGLFGFVIGLRYLREYREGTAGRFDLPGFIFSAAGLAFVLFALSEGPQKGWGSAEVVGSAFVGVAMFVALIFVETHVAAPMLAFRLYRERMFRNANILLTLTFGSFAGVLFLLPLFLQELRGLTALQSGLTTFPQAVGVLCASQIVGRLYHPVGPRRLVIGGILTMAIVTSMFLLVDLHTSLWWIRAIMFGRGLGMAFAFVPMQAATYANISPEDTGRASALYSTQRQMSAALGVAVLATVLLERTRSLTAGVTDPHARAIGALGGYHAAFLAATVLTVLAAALALLIRDADAAATIRRRGVETEPLVVATAD